MKKCGISLIILIVTIIVMIVLASAVILSLSTSGIIGKSNIAKVKSDLSNLQEVVVLKATERTIKDLDITGRYKLSEWGIDSPDYEDQVIIDNGNIIVSRREEAGVIEKAAEELGILTKIGNTMLENTTGANLVNYRIYGNSVQDGTPTPNSPVEVQSVGEKTNLFDKSKATLGKNLNVNNGLLYDSSKRCVSDYIEVDATKNYTLVYNSDIGVNTTRYICSYDKDKNYLGMMCTVESGNWYSTVTISFKSSEVKYIRANCFWNEDETLSEIDDFGIYEGYGDNLYKISVKVSGKNLLDKNMSQFGYCDNYVTKTGYSIYGVLWSDLTPYTGQTSNWYITNPIQIEPNTVYSFWGLQSANNPGYFFLKEDKTTIIEGSAILYGSGSFTTPSEARYIVMGIRSEYLDTMTLVKGEPVITDIYLDEPLRKVGDYADYIDFASQVVVRKVGYKNFTKTGQNTTYDGTTSTTANFSLNDGLHGSEFLSNRVVNGSNLVNNDNGVGTGRIYNGVFQARIEYPEGITNENTKAEKKAGVDAFFATNNIDITYQLKDSITKSIELPSISTFKGETTISVISDNGVESSNIKVEY